MFNLKTFLDCCNFRVFLSSDFRVLMEYLVLKVTTENQELQVSMVNVGKGAKRATKGTQGQWVHPV